ncbi:MAG TPA: EI24 domain-containing protein [Planctomycetota bacterium]|nr:EI24 domain-containing protein [Planctomycetota bacterium]
MKRPGFFDAMTYSIRGTVHLLNHRELWHYAVKSLLVGVVLFMVVAGIVVAYTVGLHERLFSKGLDPITGLLGCGAVIGGIIGGIILFTVIGNVIAGPFLEAMTERMMADAGRVRETREGYWAALWRSLRDQALRLLLFLMVQGALIGAYCTPVAFLHPIAATVVTAFFFAFEHLEYPLEARGMRVLDRFSWVLHRPAPALGFGATLCIIIPALGFALLPGVVCGAVLLEHDLERPEATSSGGPAA